MPRKSARHHSFLPSFPPLSPNPIPLCLCLLSSFSGRQADRLLGPPSRTQQKEQPTYGNDIRIQGGDGEAEEDEDQGRYRWPECNLPFPFHPPLHRVCGVGIMERRMKEAACSLHLLTCSTKSLWRRHCCVSSSPPCHALLPFSPVLQCEVRDMGE